MTAIINPLSKEWDKNDLCQGGQKKGFGTFLGVFVPSILMVFGVIIFLRLGMIVGQAGLVTSLLLITFATLIALVTTFSMASISTNIEVGKGGVYYLLSRSLGIEVGSAIGVPLYLKQCLSIAFCVIGFAESLNELVPLWSITEIGIGTLLTLTLLAYFSLNGALKVQLLIFVILIASLVSLFFGGSEMLAPEPAKNGFETTQQLSFWALFAIFFPAMTGIESSVSLSGDLRNPSKSLPFGTISALLVAYAIYMLIALFLAQNASLELLVSDPFIIQALAKVPALIVLGIWGATISSALGGLLGAPRTLQALAEDGVVPKIFGKNFGKMQEPRLATLTTCIISLVGIYYGSINVIAPLLTMICLICYAFLNFSAGLETLMANPSWRPRFRIHWRVRNSHRLHFNTTT
ncbi:MAG: amino acid permease [Parachlamydiaceae bacterium]|nr:amino acid permease [Parachlamydiaceae bacterium]